jgi:hypothetical protein
MIPRKAPWVSIAWRQYSEQLGANRHVAGSHGRNSRW